MERKKKRIMGKVGITRTALLGQREPLMRVFCLIEFQHLMTPAHSVPSYTVVPPPSPSGTLQTLLVARGDVRATNLIKVMGMKDATRLIRSPDNYLQHPSGYAKAGTLWGLFSKEPRREDATTHHQSNFPPGPNNKAICVGKHMHYSSFFLAETAMGEHRRAEQEARQLPAVGRRGQKRGRFSQFVLLSKQCPSEPIGFLHAHLSVGQ